MKKNTRRDGLKLRKILYCCHVRSTNEQALNYCTLVAKYCTFCAGWRKDGLCFQTFLLWLQGRLVMHSKSRRSLLLKLYYQCSFERGLFLSKGIPFVFFVFFFFLFLCSLFVPGIVTRNNA